MLRTDLVPSRHLRNNRSRAIRRRDNPALLFLGPATPAANTSPDFNTPKRPPRIVKYIVDHICEPISPNRSTSDELSAPPQGAVKTPLSLHFAEDGKNSFACAAWMWPVSERGEQAWQQRRSDDDRSANALAVWARKHGEFARLGLAQRTAPRGRNRRGRGNQDSRAPCLGGSRGGPRTNPA